MDSLGLMMFSVTAVGSAVVAAVIPRITAGKKFLIPHYKIYGNRNKTVEDRTAIESQAELLVVRHSVLPSVDLLNSDCVSELV